MGNRRTDAERDAAPEGHSWCSGVAHKCLLPNEQFSRAGRRVQRTCKACHREYMRHWRREGLPAKQKEAYDAAIDDPMARLAQKYANR